MKKDLELFFNDFLAAFGLDYVNVKDFSFSHEYDHLILDVSLNPTAQSCPICGTMSNKIKDYRTKKIKHTVSSLAQCIIHYRARRLVCPICGKTFYEHNPFTVKNHKVSVATVYNVLQELKNCEITFSYVAKKFNLSVSTVTSIFDAHINAPHLPLSECISFDETYAFKSADSDYICVLLDYASGNIIDILPSRKKIDLMTYFTNMDKAELEKVKYVSFDMWKTYRIVAKHVFPNCKCIVDKFHVLQELNRRVRSVRIEAMNKLKKRRDELEEKEKLLKESQKKLEPQMQEELKKAREGYYLLKKFNFLLTMNDPEAMDPNVKKRFNKVLNRYLNFYDIYELLLKYDERLREAVYFNDRVSEFYKKTEYKNAKKELEEIIIECRTSNIRTIQDFSKTLIEWKQEIINSFIVIPNIKRKMNNALIENRNKSIKLLKHSSNGYGNWTRFRKRILYCLNKNTSFKL